MHTFAGRYPYLVMYLQVKSLRVVVERCPMLHLLFDPDLLFSHTVQLAAPDPSLPDSRTQKAQENADPKLTLSLSGQSKTN